MSGTRIRSNITLIKSDIGPGGSTPILQTRRNPGVSLDTILDNNYILERLLISFSLWSLSVVVPSQALSQRAAHHIRVLLFIPTPPFI